MTETIESIQSWLDIPYDFSRYVVIYNTGSNSPKDVTKYIREGTPYRIISKEVVDLNWVQVVIKYPNRKIAIREAKKIRHQEIIHGIFGVEMVMHTLAVYAKHESECDESLKGPTYVTIKDAPLHINPKSWERLFSRFGKEAEVSYKLSMEGELLVTAKYGTLTEAIGLLIALDGQIVGGKILDITLCLGKKECYVFQINRDQYLKCRSLTGIWPLTPQPVRRATERSMSSRTTGQEMCSSSFVRPLLCTFCNYPENRGFVEDFDSNEENVEMEDADVPWDDEFPELKEDSGVGFHEALTEELASLGVGDYRWTFLDCFGV